MRFITEFKLKYPYQLSVLETYKVKHQFDIGNKIGEIVDWKSVGDEEKENFKLEIEAFPMDKWVEFKEKIMFYLQECEDKDELPESLWVLRMIKELESFGNPVTTNNC